MCDKVSLSMKNKNTTSDVLYMYSMSRCWINESLKIILIFKNVWIHHLEWISNRNYNLIISFQFANRFDENLKGSVDSYFIVYKSVWMGLIAFPYKYTKYILYWMKRFFATSHSVHEELSIEHPVKRFAMSFPKDWISAQSLIEKSNWLWCFPYYTIKSLVFSWIKWALPMNASPGCFAASIRFVCLYFPDCTRKMFH